MNIKQIIKERTEKKFQMMPKEIYEIVKIIKPPVNFLVFGMGKDSILWHNINKNGKTVFIEDNNKWFYKIIKEYSFLKAFLINYGTVREDWKNLINKPEELYISDLNKNLINDKKYDVILVDGPRGDKNGKPGRMKSIFMASKLIKKHGHIFVHDCNRKIEKVYCDKYIGKKHLVNKTLKLAHYIID